MAGARRFFDETVDELKKVTWPDAPQLRNSTFVILVFVVIVSAIIWLMDVAVRGVLGVVLDIFAG
ncbi:MAG TPA: preprotein translocase subunit SecE [Thermoanaerobaculia bacterium]|nr:preprotein translocase subunit SecE [Thermoanaerobaculia bacterium]